MYISFVIKKIEFTFFVIVLFCTIMGFYITDVQMLYVQGVKDINWQHNWALEITLNISGTGCPKLQARCDFQVTLNIILK